MTDNKKTKRKQGSNVSKKVRRAQADVREAVRELNRASLTVSGGITESRRLLVLVAARLQLIKAKVGLTKDVINTATNFQQVVKGLKILDLDLLRVNQSWNKEIIASKDDFAMPVFCIQVSEQYIQLAALLEEAFIPSIIVMDSSLTDYIAYGKPIELIAFNAPTKEHNEDGTTTEHSQADAEAHLNTIGNVSEEQVEQMVADEKERGITIVTAE